MKNTEIRTEKDTFDSPVKLKSGYANTTQEYDIDESRTSIINKLIVGEYSVKGKNTCWAFCYKY